MKLVTCSRTLVSSGVDEQTSFGISSTNQAHIMRILRDQLYTDRVLAVLREYASNAWDANRSAGRGDEPIEVELPNELQPTLVIRDHGPGLSSDDIVNIYTQYGASTKRDSDDVVGMLGIGSKAAFSYVTSFTVTSWHDRKKSVYNATLDETDVGVMQLLHEEPCDERMGVEVRVPVRTDDFQKFFEHARTLFRFFEPAPNISGGCSTFRRPWESVDDKTDRLKLKAGTLARRGYGVDVMGVLGCIPYRVSYQELVACMPERPVFRVDGIEMLSFEISDVDFSANREELKYTDRTRAALRKSLASLNDELIEHARVMWQRSDISQWERQGLLIALRHRFNLQTNALYDVLGLSMRVETSGLFMQMIRHPLQEYQHTDFSSYVFMVQDDDRNLYGFKGLPEHRQIVHPVDGIDGAAAKAELMRLLAEAQLSGARVELLSSYEWERPHGSSIFHQTKKVHVGIDRRFMKQKHMRSEFSYVQKDGRVFAASERWQPVSFTPSDDDVFVILDRFNVIGMKNYAAVFAYDKQLAQIAGVKFPRVLGYKTTPKRPIDEKSCKGMHYLKWQEALHKGAMMNKRVEKWLNAIAWEEFLVSMNASYNTTLSRYSERIKAFRNAGLPAKHDIVHYMKRVRDEAKKKRPPTRKQIDEKRLMTSFFKTEKKTFMPEVKRMSDALVKRYPLLAVFDQMDGMQDTEAALFLDVQDGDIKHWVEYIQLKDGTA